MNTENVLLAIALLLQLTEQAAKIGAVIQRAQSEGRDLTLEELKELQAADDISRQRLENAIKDSEGGN
jgi:hypothetical protein